MMDHRGSLCSASIAVGFLALAAAMSAQTLLVGTNVVFPSVVAAKQQTQIEELKTAGVQVVRVGFPDFTNAEGQSRMGYLQRLYQAGIKTDLIVDPIYPSNAPMRQKAAAFQGEYTGHPLSSADAQLSLAYYKQLFAVLDAKGIELASVELGNEYNGPSFNAEFPLPGEGRIYGVDDLEHGDAEARQIAKGFLRYIEVLQALKEARDQSTLNRRAAIVTFGVAAAGPVGQNNGPLDIVNPNETLKYLRNHGVDRFADAYGVHFYGIHPGKTATGLALAVSQCGVNGGKPCWITEWGMATTDGQSCPVQGTATADQFRPLMRYFRDDAAHGRVAAVIQFDWGAPMGSTEFDKWGIWQCGGLTEAGKVALSR